jgi:hypothetical protein
MRPSKAKDALDIFMERDRNNRNMPEQDEVWEKDFIDSVCYSLFTGAFLQNYTKSSWVNNTTPEMIRQA